MLLLDFAGIVLLSFFIVFIFIKKQRKQTDIFLVLSNLNLIILLIVDAFFQKQLTPLIFLLLNIVPLFLYPLFLIFALETLQETFHHRGRWLLFFLPVTITTSFISADLFIFHDYTKTELEKLYNSPTIIYHLLCKFFPLIFIFAFLKLIKRLNDYSKSIKERFSFVEPIEVTWLRNSTWIYICIILITLIGFLLAQFQIIPISLHVFCNFIGFLLFISIFYVSLHGINQYTISEYYGFNDTSSEFINTTYPNTNRSIDYDINKYKTSGLTPNDMQQIFEQVVLLFETNKMYLEPKLQLNDVAKALKISSHHLSQTINSCSGKPFYDFVNSYRVSHLKRLLEDITQQKFTILSLGYESGFNSKTTINRVFRQETGISPSEYQELHKKLHSLSD
ncbi:helix-turn-helix domain-containing protein [Parasediminibacterium paludis]|uniref:Helix-turn-helix domain-containing protein n=1 Tax=Parasediminibacterium paludis TaxID=908966 RepID=A0ABV8PWT6_9BACT